ncbi:MAG: c-type cytochrome domain-containing protein [Planctomycetia bacterium]
MTRVKAAERTVLVGRGGVGLRLTGAVAMTAARAMALPPARSQDAAAGRGTSFSRHVAPILATKCGACHVAGNKGNFAMPSHAALLASGFVQRGNPSGSRLLEVILTGDMPRGGGKVTADEVAVITKWIAAGAPFDGPDQTVSIDVLARGAAPAAPPSAPVKAAVVRPGEVAFSTDVAPIFITHCVTCHDDRDPEANLRMTSLDALLAGGRSKSPVVIGKGAESLLVKKLRGRGIDGQRMPLNKNPLADDVITLIERWIDEGARIDVLTGKSPLDAVAAAGRARRLSGKELAAIRFAAAEKVWQRAIPDEQPLVASREQVCLIGNLAAERMEAVDVEAASLLDRVAGELGAEDGQLLKGGVVVFAFAKPYDYSAFWQEVVGVERPRGMLGHAGVSGDVAYGAVAIGAGRVDEPETRRLLAEQSAAAALAGRELPPWFVRGAGRAVAIRIVPKAPLAQEWKKEIPMAVGRVGLPKDYFSDQSDPVAAAVVGGAFVGAIATGSRLRQVVASVENGASFDDAFTQVFKMPPTQAFDAWATKAARSRGR